mmetsp:Transcript_60251/g.189365  ORF Transcript_60251/g.189365 Transcript_60251/m.189365 type:complete len:257 (+) Transcript_60251:2239-3009(+)
MLQVRPAPRLPGLQDLGGPGQPAEAELGRLGDAVPRVDHQGPEHGPERADVAAQGHVLAGEELAAALRQGLLHLHGLRVRVQRRTQLGHDLARAHLLVVPVLARASVGSRTCCQRAEGPGRSRHRERGAGGQGGGESSVHLVTCQRGHPQCLSVHVRQGDEQGYAPDKRPVSVRGLQRGAGGLQQPLGVELLPALRGVEGPEQALHGGPEVLGDRRPEEVAPRGPRGPLRHGCAVPPHARVGGARAERRLLEPQRP